MAEALISLDLSSVNTNVLLKELGERLESYYISTAIKEWIKAQYLDLVYNDNDDFTFPDELSIIDKEKFDFFYKNYTNITLEQLETLTK
jgi:hypothetical protein